MVKLGFHVSIAGAFSNAVERAQALGCDTFQIFTRSPRVWAAKPIDTASADAFMKALTASGIGPVVDHMPYLPNPAAEKPEIYERSVATLTDELNRCSQLKIPYLVTHLGHHGAEGHKKGQEKVIAAIGHALDNSAGDTMILLENTANEKNTVGGTFTDVGAIADGLGREPRVGFCFDTCHAAAAGYDLKGHGAETVFEWFADEAGDLSRLKVIHLNDMKGGIGSHLDRHEHLGLGTLGEETIHDVLTFPNVSHCSFIMETPSNEIRDDAGNMAVARRLCNDIFNHTSLYQYHHGKLYLHLTLPFEERPKSNQPGEYLRYYRLRNNLTTRQLAEQVGIVPATLLKYEQGRTPIPYDTAVRLSERLKIDVELLCDSFAAFIASPYTEALKATREELKLNQREFAELVGLKASYYYQIEKGNRRPSRKVYQQIMDVVNAKQSTNIT